MRELLSKHWGALVAVLPCLVFAILYINGSFVNNYDAAGHRIMIESMRQFWPWPIGWDNSTFMGHMYGEAYPMLLHWVMTGISFVIGVELSIKLVVAISIVVLPIAIYWYLSKRKNRSLDLFVILALLLLLPGYIGSNFSGLFIYGMLPAFIALPLLFTLLGSINRITDGRKFFILSILLFTAIVWSHLVIALVAGVFILAKMLAEKSIVTHRQLIAIAITGAVAGIPLLASTLIIAGSTMQTSRSISSLLVINASLLVGMSVLVIKYRIWHKSFEARVAIILLILACLMPLLAEVSSLSLLHHAYRLQLFAYIFVILAVTGLFKLKSKHLRIFTIIAMIILATLSIYRIRDYKNNEVIVAMKSSISGRFIESFRRVESFPAPYAGQQKLAEQGGQWVNGLFVETAPNAPFIQSLIKSLRPSAYSDLGSSIDEVIKSPDDTRKLLGLFGISHVISLDKDSDGSIGSLKTNSTKLYYHDQKMDTTSLVTILDPSELQPVAKNWNQAIDRWWRKDIDIFLYDASLGNISAKSPAKNVKIVEYSRVKIVVDIDSDHPAPILIKETYNSKWQAKDTYGNPVVIYKFSPFLMMIESKGQVTLTI